MSGVGAFFDLECVGPPMAPSLWVLCANLLTGGFVGLLVATLHARDDPVLFFGLLTGALIVLALLVGAIRKTGLLKPPGVVFSTN